MACSNVAVAWSTVVVAWLAVVVDRHVVGPPVLDGGTVSRAGTGEKGEDGEGKPSTERSFSVYSEPLRQRTRCNVV